MIEVKNISKTYDGKKVLNDFSCSIPDTGITVLRGASGIGKTTLIRIIAGLEKADGGRVEGTADKKISVVFQEDRLFAHMTALENASVASDEKTAEKFLKEFGLGEDMDKKPDELSGGMCRRVAIARALAFGGDLLILDEPFKGLDAGTKETVFGTVVNFAKTAAVLLVTHDHVDAGIADRVIDIV